MVNSVIEMYHRRIKSCLYYQGKLEKKNFVYYNEFVTRHGDFLYCAHLKCPPKIVMLGQNERRKSYGGIN